MTKTEPTTAADVLRAEVLDLRDKAVAEYEAAKALADANDPEVNALLADVADGLYGGDPA